MPSTSSNDPKDSNHHETQPALPLWRRKIRGVRLPVLPVHNSEGNRDLSVTTSKGNIYLLDQFREKVPLPIRNRSIAMLSEFVGTFLFMLIGLGGNSTIINDPAMELQYESGEVSANPAKVLVIAVIWGVAVTVNTWTFFRISGGLFNPAVTMALMIVRAVEPFDGFLDIFSQLLGSIMVSAIAATTYTGAGINPARAFSVCVVLGTFPSYHWIYWLGPALGALLATAFYQLICKLEY
ncbi:hypothetical protein TW65_04305 [Stemphylium lycopersici]|uniref:Aquaporin-like protein n=1 Tax=Stemphylium lycopersici TaxID=183478 RepID=A0A364MZV7_STELY|nr:hypothetical protein TW65_04305 [Stemphylium lycopersici]RAR08240.1 aquaporin-like protein [Stemphylium lycopersici]